MMARWSLLLTSLVFACAPHEEDALDDAPAAIQSQTTTAQASSPGASPSSPVASPSSSPGASPSPTSGPGEPGPTPTPAAAPGPPACLPLRVQASIDRLIADLASPTYSVREAAQRELTQTFCSPGNRCIAEYLMYRTREPIAYQAGTDRAEVDTRLAAVAKQCNGGCDMPKRAVKLRALGCQYDFPAATPPGTTIGNYRCRFDPVRPVDCEIRADIDNDCSRDGTRSPVQRTVDDEGPVALYCPSGGVRLTNQEATTYLGQYFPNGSGCPATARYPQLIATSQSQSVSYAPPADERDHCSNVAFDPANPAVFGECTGFPPADPEDRVRDDLIRAAPPRACNNVEMVGVGEAYDACIDDALYAAKCGQ